MSPASQRSGGLRWLARQLCGPALCVVALSLSQSLAIAQQQVPLDSWVAAGLPDGAWIEPFNAVEVGERRLQNLPPLDQEVMAAQPPSHEPGISRPQGQPIVRAVGYELTSTSKQPILPGDTDAPEQVPVGEVAEEAAGREQSSAQQQEQTFGERPTNNNLQFLRRDSILIGAGKSQFDYGFNYTHFENDVPVAQVNELGEVVGVTEGTVYQRLLFSPFGYRYGISDRWQFNAYLPIGWASTQFAAPGVSTDQSTGGLGDLTAGLSWQIWEGECQYDPDTIATFGFTAPTGDFNAPLFGLVPGSALGQGFWAINANLLFVHRYDPIIAFYGVGYRHLFERSLNGAAFQPGEQISYQFGVGFAVNDRVTLSSTLFGYYVTDTEINRQTIPGSNLEPISLRFAATFVRNCQIIEPFASVGMTEAAPSAFVGVIFTLY